jgi:hypothetical protein
LEAVSVQQTVGGLAVEMCISTPEERRCEEPKPTSPTANLAMPIPAKNIIRAKDIRIAKVGRTPKAIPCQQIFSSYLENLRSGTHGNVPKNILKSLHDCGEEWERV